MATDFGADVSTFPVLDRNFGAISGTRGLAERIARRLTTAKGTLFYAPDEGLDVRAYLSRGLGPTEISGLSQAVESEILRDEQVESVDVLVTVNQAAESVVMKLELTTAEGPFGLVLSADKLTLEILSVDE